MAIDTAQKRRSAATVGSVFHPVTITPDGTFDRTQRQNIAWVYAGVVVGPPPITVRPVFKGTALVSIRRGVA